MVHKHIDIVLCATWRIPRCTALASTSLTNPVWKMQAELATVKDELMVTQQEKQALQMQMVEKERALQATKADLIETRLELQRTESRLNVCVPSLACTLSASRNLTQSLNCSVLKACRCYVRLSQYAWICCFVCSFGTHIIVQLAGGQYSCPVPSV